VDLADVTRWTWWTVDVDVDVVDVDLWTTSWSTSFIA